VDFGGALAALRNGETVRRAGWGGERDWWVRLWTPAEGDAAEWPFFLRRWTDGTVAWAPTHADLLAEDWELV
jgi:hypothetical protein